MVHLNTRLLALGFLLCLSAEAQTGYVGCFAFKDPRHHGLEPGFSAHGAYTPQSCQATCYQRGKQFAALLQGNSCHCVSRYNAQAAAAENACTVPCAGDTTKACGGLAAYSLYVAQPGPAVQSTPTPATLTPQTPGGPAAPASPAPPQQQGAAQPGQPPAQSQGGGALGKVGAVVGAVSGQQPGANGQAPQGALGKVGAVVGAVSGQQPGANGQAQAPQGALGKVGAVVGAVSGQQPGANGQAQAPQGALGKVGAVVGAIGGQQQQGAAGQQPATPRTATTGRTRQPAEAKAKPVQATTATGTAADQKPVKDKRSVRAMAEERRKQKQAQQQATK